MEQGTGGRTSCGASPIQGETGSGIRLGAPHIRIGGEIRFLPCIYTKNLHCPIWVQSQEYLDRLRNEHAVRRLQYTGDSVTDIARVCGYQDVYQFSKAFKKRNGLSPTEYRRKQRTDA